MKFMLFVFVNYVKFSQKRTFVFCETVNLHKFCIIHQSKLPW